MQEGFKNIVRNTLIFFKNKVLDGARNETYF